MMESTQQSVPVIRLCTIINTCTHKIGMPKFINFGAIQNVFNWGEPERAPHKREVCAVGLSICPYVHDTKIYKNTVADLGRGLGGL